MVADSSFRTERVGIAGFIDAWRDIEIRTDAAAVWTLRDIKLVRVEFNMDVDEARRSAGLAGRG